MRYRMSKPDACSGCALERTGSGYTAVDVGSRYSGLLIIGESPTEGEVRESLPSRPYSQGGSMLADAMREVCISRSEVAVTDIVRCRPPRDWLIGSPWIFSAVSNCTKNYLHGVIEELKPKAILAMGDVAYK